MDTSFKRNSNGGVNGFPSGEFYTLDHPDVVAFLANGGVIQDEYTLVDARQIQWKKVKDERDRRKSQGIKVGSNWFPTGGNYAAEHLYLEDLAETAKAGGALDSDQLVDDGTNVRLDTMDNGSNLIKVGEAITIAKRERKLFGDLRQVAQDHKNAIMASTDPLNYNYLTGWPLGYGE